MFESEKTSMAVDPVLTSTSTNTKSKKKRNRKKKKKGATASTASTNTTKTRTKSNKNNILTPQEILRIDKMMGEMLDKGLPYDEYNAVLNYLQSSERRSTDVSITVGVKAADVDVDVDIEDGRNNSKEVDTKVTTEPELLSPSSQPSDGGRSDKDTEQDNNNGDVITFKNSKEKNIEVDDVDDHDEDEEEEESQQAKSPTTMTAKLDMVAGFENLTDAIFALTQWVNKAAKLEEIEDLCRAEKTSALSTIVRRGISTEVVTDPTTVDTVVQPGLVELLVCVLHRFGVEFDNGERMEHMLKQARKVSLLGATGEQDEFEEEAENDVANQVATFIVSRIGLLMTTMTQKNC
mmetsp:Transcript_26132/g.30137  ORF Transcript_26132/g.30137 Transcript_26132/m.30137 type:complete len:349 (-) Transcript_26132:331-1377(-)